MPANNEIVTALPVDEAADKEVLRQWAVTRVAYCLAPSEDSQDFVAIDPSGAGTTPALIQNGMIYGLDDADSTTDHDGVTCLVSYDAKRYKLETGTRVPFNVLDKDLTAPPTSPAPSYGDAYLIYGTPTGTWAGQGGKIAIFTARGWSHATVPLGFLVFVRDENAYYHRDSAGAWTLGTGVRTLGANSVVLSNAVGFGRNFIVENQTTTAPPASPSTGDSYVIAPSATGNWLGLDGKVAICEDGATFTVYTPGLGWLIYDKALKSSFTWNGTAWLSTAGTWIDRKATALTTNGSSSLSAPGGLYVYSFTTAPTTSQRRVVDNVTLSFAAKRSGATLRFEYSASFTSALTGSLSVTDSPLTIALFRDSGSAAIAWIVAPGGIAAQSVSAPMMARFEVSAPDASAHTYTIAIMSGAANASANMLDVSLFGRRLLTVQEAA
jgi:hypothetical protein